MRRLFALALLLCLALPAPTQGRTTGTPAQTPPPKQAVKDCKLPKP
jgi:hypothetical protein